jgi:hypothetical protein
MPRGPSDDTGEAAAVGSAKLFLMAISRPDLDSLLRRITVRSDVFGASRSSAGTDISREEDESPRGSRWSKQRRSFYCTIRSRGSSSLPDVRYHRFGPRMSVFS